MHNVLHNILHSLHYICFLHQPTDTMLWATGCKGSNSSAVHYWKRQRVRETREQTSHHVCNLSASSNQASGTKGHRDTEQFSPRLLFKRILTYWQQRSLSGTRLLWSGREQIDPLSSGGLLVVTIRTASDQSRNCYHYCYYYLMISQALARPHFWSMDRSRVGEGAIGPPPWVNRMDSDTSLDSDTLDDSGRFCPRCMIWVDSDTLAELGRRWINGSAPYCWIDIAWSRSFSVFFIIIFMSS